MCARGMVGLWVALLVLLVSSGSALAARATGRVYVSSPKSFTHPPYTLQGALHYEAAPGQRDAVTLLDVDPIRLRTTDAALTVGAGCRREGGGVIACKRPEDEMRFSLGDGDDSLSAEGEDLDPRLGLKISAGPGNDIVDLRGVEPEGNPEDLGVDDEANGGDGADVLYGERGSTILRGGGGPDVLHGGPGEDEMNGDGQPGADRAPGSDVIDGAGGKDFVSYAERHRPVRVDLQRPNESGAAGEHDRLRSIEDIQGGQAGDRLSGDDRANLILADPGTNLDTARFFRRSGPSRTLRARGAPNVVLGRGGDDKLDGGARGDRLFGGPGSDDLSAAAGSHARLDCGSGLDSALPVEPFPASSKSAIRVLESCEVFRLGDFDVAHLSSRRGRVTGEAAAESDEDGGYDDRGGLSLRGLDRGRRPGVFYGRVFLRFRTAARGVHFRFRLSRAGREAVRHHRRAVLREVYGTQDCNRTSCDKVPLAVVRL